jgi:hypothetical protein
MRKKHPADKRHKAGRDKQDKLREDIRKEFEIEV